MSNTAVAARQPPRRRLKGSSPARSVRVPDERWNRAISRAEYENITISSVINSLLEGYSKGFLNLPQIKVIYETVN